MVLANFLQDHHQGFAKTIRTWPSNLYDIQNIIVAVEDTLKRSGKDSVLMDALAELYAFSTIFFVVFPLDVPTLPPQKQVHLR